MRTQYTVEVTLSDNTVRRVRDVKAYGPNHAMVSATDALKDGGYRVLRVNFVLPALEASQMPSTGRSFAVRQAERAACLRTAQRG